MTEDTFLEQIGREAMQLRDEIMENKLRTDPRRWKVLFNDIRKKYHIEKICLTKEPPNVSFTILQSCYLSNDFEYIGNPDQKCWDFEKCSIKSEAFMYDLLDAGIITEDGEVNYEVRCGVVEK